MGTSSLDAILNQYEKAQQSGGDQSRMSQDERMKKYFFTYFIKRRKTRTKKT
jgi:hypothetical protein